MSESAELFPRVSWIQVGQDQAVGATWSGVEPFEPRRHPARREPRLQGFAVHERVEHAGHWGVDDACGGVRSRHGRDVRSGLDPEHGAPLRRIAVLDDPRGNLPYGTAVATIEHGRVTANGVDFGYLPTPRRAGWPWPMSTAPRRSSRRVVVGGGGGDLTMLMAVAGCRRGLRRGCPPLACYLRSDQKRVRSTSWPASTAPAVVNVSSFTPKCWVRAWMSRSRR